MRIKRLEIYGYGKWVDTTFDLAEDVHLFYGVNETGKSTLMSFIHSILFGFPTRNSTLLRYEPRESSRYGGKIIADDARFGEVIIERIHGKVTGNVTVTLEDGTTGTDELLASVMYGMERETFQNIFSFSLSEIENVHQLDKNQLSRYLLNIGAHGTEHYLELVDQFREEANRLYRPSGRVLDLNAQLAVLEKQEQHLVELEKRNESYLGLIEKSKAQNQEIKEIDAAQKKLEKELTNLNELKKKWHIFEEIRTLAADIKETSLPALKEDGRYLLDEYKRDLVNLNEQLQEVARKQSAQKESLEQPEMLESYEENKEAINTLENELPEIVEQLRDFENVNEKRTETQKLLNRVEQDLGIENNPDYPTAFSNEETTAVKKWQELYEATLENHQEIAKKIQAAENELSLKNQSLDQYEAMMWENQELKAVENELSLDETEQEPTNRMGPLVSGIVGLLLVSGVFFVEAPMNWLLGLFAAIAFIFSFVLFRNTHKDSVEPNEFLVKEYEKQLVLKDEWRESLGEVDAMQANHQAQLKKRDDLLKEQQAIIAEWQQLLANHQLPQYLELEQAAFVTQSVQTLHELLEEDKQYQQTQTQFSTFLEDKTAPIDNLVALNSDVSLQDKVSSFRQYLNQLKAALTKEEEKLNQLNALKQEAKQLEASKQAAKEKTTHLIGTAGVKTEAEFMALYKEKEALDKKIRRLSFLKENAPEFAAHKKLPTKEEVIEQEKSLAQQLKELASKKDLGIRQQANTQLSIENLEKDGTYTEELQEFENQKAIVQRLVDEWVSYKLAAGMIQETLNQVTKERFQEIIADAEDYFHLLTDAKYERIVFKDDELFVQHRNGQVVDVRVLSRGTSEPLYVAIRLAYIKNTQDMMELPIIMDDPFVNFDVKRQQNMYQLLEKLGKDLQIIYFTFDSSAQNYFTEQQQTQL